MPGKAATTTTCGPRKLVAKTCPKCERFLMAVMFYFDRKRMQYHGWCLDCQRRQTSITNRRNNDESYEKAKNHYQVWTSDETDLLWRLVALGLSDREIAERLGRSRDAVSVKKGTTRVAEGTAVQLHYYDSRDNEVRDVGHPYYLNVKNHEGRLHTAASHLAELHTQLIFFITVLEGGEYMGIRGLDALKEGDDREPEDTSEDVENAPVKF